MGEVERLKELLAQTGGHDWARTTEDNFDYDFSVPGNYSHIWVRTGPRHADRIAVGAGLIDDDVLDARVDLVLAAHNDLPALLSQLEEMRERERKAGVLLREHIDAYEELEMAHVAHALGSGPDEAVRNQRTITDAKRRMLNAVMASKRALLSQTDEGERMEGDGE